MRRTFTDFFRSIAPKTVLITSHENADPDALCSAFSIAHLIENLHPEVKSMVSLDGISNVSQKIIQNYNLNVIEADEMQIDAIIIVDANNIEQLGNLKNKIEWKKPVFIIDHHVPHPKIQEIAQFSIIDDSTVATTELIYQLYHSLNVIPKEITAALIFLGIIYDSRHLLLASNRTISIVNQLLELGVNYAEMVDLLAITIERPERIARLKAAQRLQLHEFNGWLVAISHISAYEASACRALIRLGADVALVYGRTKDEIRFSGRASSAVAKQTNLNLATDIMARIAPIMQGAGGGHSTAAGCNGKDNLEGALELALKLLREILTEKSNSI